MILRRPQPPYHRSAHLPYAVSDRHIQSLANRHSRYITGNTFPSAHHPVSKPSPPGINLPSQRGGHDCVSRRERDRQKYRGVEEVESNGTDEKGFYGEEENIC